MPRRKSTQDPLLAAVIAKLPPSGSPFSTVAREDWLDMMRLAFDVSYGREGQTTSRAIEQPVVTAPPPVPVLQKEHVKAGCAFYVDMAGVARSDEDAPGHRVLGNEIPGDEVIYDYRAAPRDRDMILWADDTMGALPGMSFCGPG